MVVGELHAKCKLSFVVVPCNLTAVEKPCREQRCLESLIHHPARDASKLSLNYAAAFGCSLSGYVSQGNLNLDAGLLQPHVNFLTSVVCGWQAAATTSMKRRRQPSACKEAGILPQARRNMTWYYKPSLSLQEGRLTV